MGTADAGYGYGYSKSWRSELDPADVLHAMVTTRHDTVVTRYPLDFRHQDHRPSPP
jgi:hypothetical protein